MAFRSRFTHSLLAGLTCVGLISGCACDCGRRMKLPRLKVWPQNWAAPSWGPATSGPPMPVPADPSGSPHQQSPRGPYLPSSPAPESKLGLPVPPPLPFGAEADEEAPRPEVLPPPAEDLDVSFQNRPSRRSSDIPPPPPMEDAELPRIAERTAALDRYHQPVSLEAPEVDYEPDSATEVPPEPLILRRSPSESFPQPNPTDDAPRRGDSGHSKPFDDEESDEELLPEPVNSSTRRP